MIYLLKRFCKALGYQLIPLQPSTFRRPSVSSYKHVEVYDNDWYD